MVGADLLVGLARCVSSFAIWSGIRKGWRKTCRCLGVRALCSRVLVLDLFYVAGRDLLCLSPRVFSPSQQFHCLPRGTRPIRSHPIASGPIRSSHPIPSHKQSTIAQWPYQRPVLALTPNPVLQSRRHSHPSSGAHQHETFLPTIKPLHHQLPACAL